DAPNHGARFTGDEQARLGLFWQTLHGNLTEFAGLRGALLQAGLVEGKRLAVAGASMGGMTALGIMARHPEVTSVACLMGSGYFMSLAKTLF
ncbi:esterase, partial [Escherichia coli]|nr:esterase [Escherichia coli]